MLKSASRGPKIRSKTFLKTSRLWICCSFTAGYFSMSFNVIFRRNGQKGNIDVGRIWRLWSNRQVDVSETQIYWPFLLLARIVCKMCLVWTAEWRDIRNSKGPPLLMKQSKSLSLWRNSTTVAVHSTTSRLISPLSRYVHQHHWIPLLVHTTYVP